MLLANAHNAGRILVVDDDLELASTLREFLEQEGYPAVAACSGVEALAIVDAQPRICLALVDLMMPEMDGLALMQQLHRRHPDLPVLIMTGYGTIETAVQAIKEGAEDYLTKPFDPQAVRKKIARLMEVFELRDRVGQLETNLDGLPSFESFIYVHPAMQRIIERAQAAAASDAPVLILGETGTGKERLARAVHATSRRARQPFVAVNCGGLPRDLAESELFGFRRGAFTGATSDSEGIFAGASGGTVFLDEIGEMPKELQVKLLRVLQEGELRPLGTWKTTAVDVRIIAATNRSAATLRGERLREDLYFRIATVTIEIPPLRSRPEDILVLSQHYVSKISRQYNRQIALSHAAQELLLRYEFPGNVRELQNLLESCAAVSRADPQLITERDLKPNLQPPTRMPVREGLGEPQALSVERTEQVAIERALRLCQGNRTRAAAVLGISRDTLYRKLRQYGTIN